MKDLKDLKVGDKVWTIENGYTKVSEIQDGAYPIKVGSTTYTIDGKQYECDLHPSLFLTNPFEQQGKWMMVRSNEYDWNVKNVIVTNNGIYVESGWLEAKEIPEPNELILSMQEIADKFGVDVETLKIKK